MCTTRIYLQAGRGGGVDWSVRTSELAGSRREECVRAGFGKGRGRGGSRGRRCRVGVTLSKYLCQDSVPEKLLFNRDFFSGRIN